VIIIKDEASSMKIDFFSLHRAFSSEDVRDERKAPNKQPGLYHPLFDYTICPLEGKSSLIPEKIKKYAGFLLSVAKSGIHDASLESKLEQITSGNYENIDSITRSFNPCPAFFIL